MNRTAIGARFVSFLAAAAWTMLAACQATPPAAVEDEGTPVTGVWAFVSETNAETGQLIRDDSTWSGIWVFTGSHHCLARMDNNRTGHSAAEVEALPLEEQVAYYRQLLNYSSTAGAYEVEGNILRRRWQISQGPEIIGLESVATFEVADDRLIVDLPRRTAESGPAVRVVYRRLE